MWQEAGLLWLLKLLRQDFSIISPCVFVTFKQKLVGAGNAHTWDGTRVSDFDGYGNVDCAYVAAPSIDGTGKGTAETGVMSFTRASTGAPQSIVGIGLVGPLGSGSEEILWYDDSFAAVVMENVGDTFERVVKFGDDTMVVVP